MSQCQLRRIAPQSAPERPAQDLMTPKSPCPFHWSATLPEVLAFLTDACFRTPLPDRHTGRPLALSAATDVGSHGPGSRPAAEMPGSPLNKPRGASALASSGRATSGNGPLVRP